MLERSPSWQPWTAIAGFSLLVHFAWETLQAPLYQGMATRPHWSGVLDCTRATLGDAVIALAAYAVPSLMIGNRFWLAARLPVGIRLFLATGLALTVLLEYLNVHLWHRWSYATRMPQVLGLGLAPLVQWTVLPPLVLWLTRRHLCPGRSSTSGAGFSGD